MELRDLDTRGGEWLRGDGAQGDVVISSRVRLARNLAGFSFLAKASEADRKEIIETLRGPLMSLGLTSRAFWMDLEDAVARLHVGKLGHERDDVGLTDRLPVDNRKGSIRVVVGAFRLGHEEMARHPAHRLHRRHPPPQSALAGRRRQRRR